jgi:hypothetical protein
MTDTLVSAVVREGPEQRREFPGLDRKARMRLEFTGLPTRSPAEQLMILMK